MQKVISVFYAIVFTFLVSTNISYGGSLIAHWKFGESDGKRVFDISGNKVDGKIIGKASFANGDYGRAMVFDGSTYLDFGAAESVQLNKSFTLELWIKPHIFPRGEYRMILGKSDEKNRGWQLYHAGWDNNIWLYGERDDKSFLRNYLRTGYIMGGWRYFVVTYDGKQLKFYVDGSERSNVPAVGGFMSVDAPLRIGKMGVDQQAGNFFEGEISEIKIYDYDIGSTKIWLNSRASISAGVKVLNVPSPMNFSLKTVNDDRSREEWLATHRSVGWPVAPGINADQANEICINLKSKGFDTIYVAGSYRYMFSKEWGERNWWNAVPWDVYLKTTGIFSKACKDNDLKLVMHLTANLALYNDYEHLFKGMETRTVDTNEPGHWPEYFGYGLCLNNPTFQQIYLERLKEMLSKVKPDGLMIDETGFAPSVDGRMCGCKYCRSLFKERYGFEVPSDLSDKSVWENWQNEQWRSWMKFRIECVGQWHGKLKAALDGLVDNALFTSCSCSPLQPSNSRGGGDPEAFMQHGNVYFYECEPGTPWSWRKVVAEGKFVNALGPVILFSPENSVSQSYWTHILGMAHGWLNHQWPEFNDYRIVPVVWQQKWQKLWLGCESPANIAVVFSTPTMNLTGKYLKPENDMTEYVGWASALTELHVPFDVIFASQINNDKLSRYDVVILPDVSCLSQSQNDVLRDYVKSGGNMISTDESSVYNYDGGRREDFGLNDVFGIKLKSIEASRTVGSLKGKYGSGYLAKSKRFCSVEPVSASVLLEREEANEPMFVVNEYGEGKSWYIAFPIGTEWYMPQVGVGWYGEGGYWPENRELQAKRLIQAVLKDSVVPVLQTENVPDEVIVNVTRHSTRGYKGTQIHLVNAVGTRFDKYALVPPKSNFEFIEYPPISGLLGPNKKMIFKIQAQNVSGVYFVSPDFYGVVKIDSFEKDGNTIKITLPDLYRYGIIYLVQSEKDLIRETEDLVLDKIPAVENFDFVYTSER